MWDIQNSIWVARMCEALVVPLGWHCSMGGSVLHKGESGKDLDIFFYRHATNDTQTAPIDSGLERLQLAGIFAERAPIDHSAYGDDKVVFHSQFQSKRIDLFFL